MEKLLLKAQSGESRGKCPRGNATSLGRGGQNQSRSTFAKSIAY